MIKCCSIFSVRIKYLQQVFREVVLWCCGVMLLTWRLHCRQLCITIHFTTITRKKCISSAPSHLSTLPSTSSSSFPITELELSGILDKHTASNRLLLITSPCWRGIDKLTPCCSPHSGQFRRSCSSNKHFTSTT